MSKKNFIIAGIQMIVIGAFIMIALGCGGSSLTPEQAYDAGYNIGYGVGTLINN